MRPATARIRIVPFADCTGYEMQIANSTPATAGSKARMRLVRGMQSKSAEVTIISANPMKLESLHDLYIHELQDLHSAESQIKTALPKAIRAAKCDELKTALEEHLEVTKGHVERLNTILKRHGAKSGREKCQGMEGLLAEAESMLERTGDDVIFDLGIIAACQRVEHYEISGYGTARAYAVKLSEEEDVSLLAETLEEESAADDELTGIATMLQSQCHAASEEDPGAASAGTRRGKTAAR